MLIQSQGALSYEIMKVKNAVKTRDSQSIQTYYDNYINLLRVPKKEVVHQGFLTFCSDTISYHLLSVYLLLDLIEYFWNGKRFIDVSLSKKMPLLEELSLDTKKEIKGFNEIIEASKRIKKISKTPLHVFFLPFEHSKEYLLDFTFPGNILVIFPQEDEYGNTLSLELFYQGIADFYLEKQLKGIVPPWANDKEMFTREFIKWCKDKPSKFY